jgi:hypothetical protein
VEVRRSHCDLGATSLREWRGGGVGLTRSSVTRATRRSGHPGGWADWRAGGRTGGDTFGGTGRGADRRSCRNIRGWAAGRAIGWACRNVLGWADRGAGRWTSGKAVGRSRRNALGNPWGRACSQHLRRRRVLAPRTFVGMRSRFIGTRRRDNASLGISRVGRRPGEDGRSGATVVVQNVALDWRLVERTVGSAPDGERQRLVVPVRRLLRLRPPFRNLTGERWRTRARKVVHLRGVLGSCRVATDRSRRDNVGGRKGQCPDTRRRDNCDTMVTTTSEQQADTSCNIAVIHAQLHRPNRLRGYGPSGSRPSAARLIGARVAALLIAGPRASRTATTCC